MCYYPRRIFSCQEVIFPHQKEQVISPYPINPVFTPSPSPILKFFLPRGLRGSTCPHLRMQLWLLGAVIYGSWRAHRLPPMDITASGLGSNL